MASLLSPTGGRPVNTNRSPTAPSVLTMNGHFGTVGDNPSKESFEHGIQVIDEEKVFNPTLPAYFQY